jgi:hypothetical protein
MHHWTVDACAISGIVRNSRRRGRKREAQEPHAEMLPDVVPLARELRRKRHGAKRPSLRDISAELSAGSHLNANGRRMGRRASTRCWPASPP